MRMFAYSGLIALVGSTGLTGCGDDNQPNTGGTIHHWGGYAWSLSTRVAATTESYYLRGVWGNGPNDVWAVGLGRVLRWDGLTWTTVLRGDTDSAFVSVWGSNANDVWVAGAKLWHWNGSTWSSIALPNGVGPVSKGWSRGPNEAWAVAVLRPEASQPGWRGSSVVLHWDGAAWTIHWRGSQMEDDGLSSIWGTPSGDVWAAGWRDDTDFGLLVHWNGFTWTVTGPPTNGIAGVWASGPNDVWILRREKEPMHWDGSAWSLVVGTAHEDAVAVWGNGPNDV